MRFRIFAALVSLLLPSAALAQYQGCRQISPGVNVDVACIQLSAQNLLDSNGLKLAAGKVVLTVTDASGTPVSYTPFGGSSTSSVFTAQVLNGTIQNIAGFPYTIVNTLNATPSGLLFHYQLESLDGSLVYLDVPKMSIFSSTGQYSLDQYAAGALTSITGLGYPRMACAPTAKYTQTDAISGAKPWLCSNLWRTDHSNQWTQNPSANTQCQNGQAIVSPRAGAGPPYCIQPENAYVLPGEGFINNDITNPGPMAVNQIGNGSGGSPALPLGVPQTDIITIPPTPARSAGAEDIVGTPGTGTSGAHPQWMSYQPITVTQTLVSTTFNEGSAGAPVVGTAPATNIPGHPWVQLGPSYITAPHFVSGGGMSWNSNNGTSFAIDLGSYGGTVTYTLPAGQSLGFTTLADPALLNFIYVSWGGGAVQINKIVAGNFVNVANYSYTPGSTTDTWAFTVSGQNYTTSVNGTVLGTYTIPPGTPLTTNTLWGVNSTFGGSMTLKGFTFSGTATITQPIPAVGVNCLLQGNGFCGPITANLGIGTTSAGMATAAPEMGYSTNSDGTVSVAWAEDRNAGIYDVRRPRSGVTWATNAGQAFTNTQSEAMCNSITTHTLPQIKLPAGLATFTNIILAPGSTMYGTPGMPNGQYGGLTFIRNSDPTHPEILQSGSFSTTCNGVATTFSGTGGRILNVSLIGNGSANPNDIGVFLESFGGYLGNDSFSGFGGPGVSSHSPTLGTPGAVNDFGDHLFFQSNLSWYFLSGAYNTTAFTDTAYHASAELDTGDPQYSDVIEYGFNPDTFVAGQGYYNRWLLCGVLVGGSAPFPFTRGFIQINPNGICLSRQGVGGYVITENRIDFSWFNSVRLPSGPSPQRALISHNQLEGYCTSNTLNPVNFPNDPGGVSPDPYCAAVRVEETFLSSTISNNQYASSPGLVPQWAIGEIYTDLNVSGQAPTVIDEPGQRVIGIAQGGYPPDGNQNADVSKSVLGETRSILTSAGGTLNLGAYRAVYISSAVPTVWNALSGQYNDTVRYLDPSPNDTIQNTSKIHLCGGVNLTGDGTRTLHPGIFFAPDTFWEFACGGSGGSGVPYPGATQNYLPAANITGGVTSLVNSHFWDDGTNTHDDAPLFLVGEYQNPTGTATSSVNYVSNVTNWVISYWNGTVATQAAWNVYAWVAQGGTLPASVLTYYAPAGLTTTAVLYAIDPGLLATSSINYSSPKFKVRGDCWNGTTATLSDFNWQLVHGTGANPTATLQFTYTGCGGTAVVEMPGLKLDGTPMIASGVSTNTDISGELAFSAATSQSFTWQNTYVSHPECGGIEPNFSTTVNHWVTYTGTTSFTINFASAVTGTVSYTCTGRN